MPQGEAAPRRRRSLSVRGYLLLLAFTVLLPLLALAGLLTVKAVEGERARAAQALDATAGGVLTAVTREVSGLIETLQTLEASPNLTSGDVAAFGEHIGALSRVFGIGIALHDPAGQPLASSPARALPQQPAVPSPARPVTVSGVMAAAPDGDAVVALTMAVQREGQVRYVLSLAPPATRLRDVLTSLGLAPDFRVSVLDPQGLVIAQSDAHDAVVGRPSALASALPAAAEGPPRILRGTERDGAEVYFLAQPTQHGWTVITSVLADRIDGPRRRALTNAGLACLLLSGAAFLAARLLGTRLASAIGGLAIAGSALDRNERVAIGRSGIREIDEVATTLAMAGERLRAAAAQRAQDEERQRLILHELNHRVKNTLAMVQALAALAARGAGDVASYRDRLAERLQGLARTQALLTESDWTGAPVHDLLRAELGVYDGAQRARASGAAPDAEGERRIVLDGPALRLPAHHVVAFGMLVHELATNAAKYGALSLPQGRIAVTWSVSGAERQARLDLVWTESGGPPITVPAHQGFGTQMIRRGLARQLGADVAADWRREGLRFTLSMPLHETQPLPASLPSASAAGQA